ncbi:MAG: glycoside hydrolase family 10 protein [Planctomycetota bacterium]
MLSAPGLRRSFRLPLALVFISCAAGAPGVAAASAPPPEVRGIWVTRWDFRSEADVRRAVRWSAALGLNRVFFQVRGRADAFYRSPFEPWGEEIGGKDPGFDPLEVAVDEARKAGVELHAWVNLLPGWKGARLPLDPSHVARRHPEWFLLDSRRKRHVVNPSDYAILNPCLPEVRTYLVAVVADIAARYAVDGIQLDYVRFADRDPKRSGEVPYDPESLALFRSYSGASPIEAPAAFDAWRGRALDVLVARISAAVRTRRPGCVLSAAVLPDFDRARRLFFQDAASWLEKGWIDAAYPMTYAADPASFSVQTAEALRRSPRGGVFPGIGVHLHARAEDTLRQIRAARSLGARGYCLFSYAQIFPSPSHEYRADPASRRLRSELRRAIFAANGLRPGPRGGEAPGAQDSLGAERSVAAAPPGGTAPFASGSPPHSLSIRAR